MTKRQSKQTISPVEFIDRVIKLDEKGEPFSLAPYQRRVLEMALRRDPSGELMFVLSEPKKSGKTFLAACLVLWWACTRHHTEIILVANDEEQATGRVFKTAVALIEHNQALKAECEIYISQIRMNNGTTITPISSDFKGAAGSRHSLVVFDEIWAFGQEKMQRLFEELTPPPSEPSAWMLIVSYAGFSGESAVLEAIYQRGMAGRRIDQELECYEANGLFMFWSHTPRQPWQDKRYYEEQRRILRPAQFERLHCNRWVSSESRLIEPEVFDACVEPSLKPDPTGELFISIDAAVKHDCAAIVCVKYGLPPSDVLVLADHRIWKPVPGTSLDLQSTVEFYVRRLQGYGTSIGAAYADPYQMMTIIQSLQNSGVSILEFNQTSGNLTAACETLYARLNSRRIKFYRAPDLRESMS